MPLPAVSGAAQGCGQGRLDTAAADGMDAPTEAASVASESIADWEGTARSGFASLEDAQGMSAGAIPNKSLQKPAPDLQARHVSSPRGSK